MKNKLLVVIFLGMVVATAGAVTSYYTISAAHIVNSLLDSTPIGNSTPSTGAFTTASASGGFVGNLTGNASTATTLATSPTQCSGSNSFAQGIAVNGNANCAILPTSPWSASQVAVTGCVPGGSTYDTCNFSVTFSSSNHAPDTNYAVTCNIETISLGGSGEHQLLYSNVAAGTKTTAGFTGVLVIEGTDTPSTPPTVDCQESEAH